MLVIRRQDEALHVREPVAFLCDRIRQDKVEARADGAVLQDVNASRVMAVITR